MNTPAESCARYGRQHYDYCDGTFVCYRAGAVCEKIPESGLWTVAFHPELFEGRTLEKRIEEYTFFSYALKEALHVSKEEKRILASCADDIRRELLRGADAYKRTILIRHITRLLDYATRFYERQFIVREPADELLIRQYENLVEQYIGEGKLAQMPLTSACCAEQLHLSEAYFNDLLFLRPRTYAQLPYPTETYRVGKGVTAFFGRACLPNSTRTRISFGAVFLFPFQKDNRNGSE